MEFVWHYIMLHSHCIVAESFIESGLRLGAMEFDDNNYQQLLIDLGRKLRTEPQPAVDQRRGNEDRGRRILSSFDS